MYDNINYISVNKCSIRVCIRDRFNILTEYHVVKTMATNYVKNTLYLRAVEK